MAKCKAVEKVFEKDGVEFPTLELRENDKKFGFTFGLVKAQLIVDNIEEIRAFLKRHAKVR